jgi:glucose-1-phosphate adenylyltransferase
MRESNRAAVLQSCLVFLLAGGKGTRLYELTKFDCKPAIPFAGSLRIVDFTLANALNSKLHNILVATQYQPATLINHIRSRWRPLFGFHGGSIECLPGQNANFGAGYLSTADAVTQNIQRIDAMAPRHILIVAADHIYQMNYVAMLQAHCDAGADVTIAADIVSRRGACGLGIMQADRRGRITGFAEKPADPAPISGLPDKSLASMGIYIFDWPKLRQLLLDDVKDDLSSHDFGKDLLPKLIARGNARAHPLESPHGRTPAYWRDVGTLDAFLDSHMDFLGRAMPIDPVAWPLHVSRIEGWRADKMPSTRSLVSHSARVDQAYIEQSVVSPLVSIGAGCVVRRSVILPGATIAGLARLTNVIVAPGTQINFDLVAGEDAKEDARWFRCSENGTLLIDQRMVNGRAEALRARKGWMPGPATAIPGYAAEAGKARNSVN